MARVLVLALLGVLLACANATPLGPKNTKTGPLVIVQNPASVSSEHNTFITQNTQQKRQWDLQIEPTNPETFPSSTEATYINERNDGIVETGNFTLEYDGVNSPRIAFGTTASMHTALPLHYNTTISFAGLDQSYTARIVAKEDKSLSQGFKSWTLDPEALFVPVG